MQLVEEGDGTQEVDEVNDEVDEPAGAGVSAVDAAELEELIGKMLDAKLAPLARQLARLEENRVSLSDIVGGIGYIVGLAGIILWASTKRTNK
jgi:nickel transport protein